MATVVNFNNRNVTEPGAYSRVTLGIPGALISSQFGGVMIIDNGQSPFYGGGAGINGELSRGGESIYAFTSPEDFQEFIRGGELYDLANPLFKPANGQPGIEALYYVKAATTKSANIIYNFSNGAGAGARANANLGLNGVTLVTAGSGYTDGSYTITLDPSLLSDNGKLQPGDTGATLDVTVTGGVVTSVTVATPGRYLAAIQGNIPLDMFGVLPAGSGAIITADFGVGEIVVSQGGADYTVAPTVQLLGGEFQTTATAASTLTADAVTAITVSSPGTGYLFAPVVNLVSSNATSGGTISIKTKNEGDYANGVLFGSQLTTGYAARLVRGTVDSSKYKIEFLQGEFRGLDEEGDPYDNIPQAEATPNIIAVSVEFSTVQEFIEWAKRDFFFNSYFELDIANSTTIGTGPSEGLIADEDFLALTGLNLAFNGLQTYSTADLDETLRQVVEADNTYFLSLDNGDNGTSLYNTRIFDHINKNTSGDYKAEFEKFLIIGGGADSTKRVGTNSSSDIASFYDSDRVLVTHSDVYVTFFNGRRKRKNTVYTASIFLGRTAGLEPQIPSTFKTVGIVGLVDDADKLGREQLLQNGVINFRFVDGSWVINQDVNTLQGNKNRSLYNDDDNISFAHSIGRITALVNKNIVLNARIPNGPFVGGNRNTASDEEVRNFVIRILNSYVATSNQDNLIISFEDIRITRTDDNKFVTYKFVPNGPINKLFFTGVIIN